MFENSLSDLRRSALTEIAAMERQFDSFKTPLLANSLFRDEYGMTQTDNSIARLRYNNDLTRTRGIMNKYLTSMDNMEKEANSYFDNIDNLASLKSIKYDPNDKSIYKKIIILRFIAVTMEKRCKTKRT
eukprot:UN08552